MGFPECLCCELLIIFFPHIDLHEHILLLEILCLDHLEFLNQAATHLRHGYGATLQIMHNVIYTLRGTDISSLLALAEEVGIFLFEQPGKRVVTGIPLIIQDKLVLGLARLDAIE